MQSPLSPEEALEQAIRAIRYHFDQLVLKHNPPEPDHLYHYTSTEGLLGIITSKKFFATDILSMRDQSEFRHGVDLARQVIRELHGSERNSVTDSLLHAFEDNPTLGVGEGFFLHAVCFCCKGDVLSQWQSFSTKGGFALGVDIHQLRKREASGHLILAKMLYDEMLQREIVEQVVKNGAAVFSQFETSLKQSRTCLNNFIFELGVTLYNSISRFKHPCFSSEDEWRILIGDHASEAAKEVRFRAGERTVVPYREVTLDLASITHIIRSPGAWPQNDSYAIERLARSIGRHVTVRTSALPFL
jgi:hypothetical protein